MKLIAGPYRSWPAEFVEAGADDAAGRGKLALDQQPHRDRGGVPAARGETAEYRAGRRTFVEVKGLRIEFGGKALDAFGIDANAAGLKGLSSFKLFQVSLDRIGHGALLVHYFSKAGVRADNAVAASRRRSFRMPASTSAAGANLRSNRRRFASPPAA